MKSSWIRRALGSGPGLLLGLALVSSSPSNANQLESKIALCESCHGANGLPSDPAIPIITGQEFYYLYVQLKDYKAGRRANPIMGGIVAQMEKEEMQALAQHFSEKKWPSVQFRADDPTITKAQQATTAGQCVQCHLGGYEGNSRVPRLAGQQPGYLEKTMLEFKNKVRLNSPAKGSLMSAYPEEDIAAMAKYLGAL
ncbi:MAG: c-type cytochrome [Gammaproteobacteria bacterium]|nr:c-type cytochrome [Gammaproteobacteria bacterium]